MGWLGDLMVVLDANLWDFGYGFEIRRDKDEASLKGFFDLIQKSRVDVELSVKILIFL